MRAIILGDTHFGVRNDSLFFHDFMERFYTQQLFPFMERENINVIIQLGDLFDRRKYVNFNTLHRCKGYFFDQIRDRGFNLYAIVGNHDTYHKNSNEVNSPNLLLKDYSGCVELYSSPTDVEIGGLQVCMLPWICSGNYAESMKHIQDTQSQVLFGHLEIAGFEMYRGYVCDHGFDKKVFDKFDLVMSGHYHHKSSYGNISYLGAPYEMTWSDWNDPRGFHVFDFQTRGLEFHENEFKMFHKVHYDDVDTDLETIMGLDFERLSGHMVKLIVHNKNNPYWFDMFINKIEDSGVLDLQVVEDNFNLNLEDDSDITENIEDTLTVLNKYTEQFKDRVNVKRLNSFLHKLYHEALSVE